MDPAAHRGVSSLHRFSCIKPTKCYFALSFLFSTIVTGSIGRREGTFSFVDESFLHIQHHIIHHVLHKERQPCSCTKLTCTHPFVNINVKNSSWILTFLFGNLSIDPHRNQDSTHNLQAEELQALCFYQLDITWYSTQHL